MASVAVLLFLFSEKSRSNAMHMVNLGNSFWRPPVDIYWALQYSGQAMAYNQSMHTW